MISLLAVTFSVTALADESSMIETDKTATYDYTTHNGIITLDSYVTGYVKLIRTAIPADIILVLDYSRSMEDNNKNTMLQKAARDFVDTLALSSQKNNVNHRIGLITFGTGAHIKTDFLSVKNNATNVSTLKSYINSACPASGEENTRYELAMMLASNMIYGGNQFIDIPNTNTDNAMSCQTYGTGVINPTITLKEGTNYCTKGTLSGVQSGSSPFIVFLTDGEPTGRVSLGNLSHFYQTTFVSDDKPGYGGGSDGSRYGDISSDTGIMFGIANHAIRTANDLKNNKNVQIYSIEIGTPTKSAKANLAEDALKAISSLYKSATRYRQKFWGTITSGTTPFYQHITSVNQTSISGAFTSIAQGIEKVISIQYGKETVMNDFINNSYFKLSDLVDPADPWKSINVYTVKCTGIALDGATRTFSMDPADTVQLTQSSGITLKIVKAETTSESGDNDQIAVYGFDYSENWCGVDENDNPHGKKLLVKVPFTFTATGVVPSEVKTNGEGSGVYPAKRDSTGTIIKDDEGNPTYENTPEEIYVSPTITFCSLTITRVGLDRGESAIYEVFCDGNFVARVPLNGTDSTTVSKTLYGLQGGEYVIKETAWNWAYNKTVYDSGGEIAGNTLTKTVDDPNVRVEFKFGGAHKTGTGPEDLHNHDEEYKVNHISVSDL